jgi:hypothetical protein
MYLSGRASHREGLGFNPRHLHFFRKRGDEKERSCWDVAQSSTDEKSSLCRGCSSVVERPFRVGKASGSIPDISNFFHKRGDEKARSWVNENSLSGRGCSTVVERSFRIGNASGSIPDVSIFSTKVQMKMRDHVRHKQQIRRLGIGIGYV